MELETILGSAGDFAGAAAWRQACRELAHGPRLAVIGIDGDAAGRLARRLREAFPRLEVEALALDVQGEEDPEEAILGVGDTLLGMHALLWATPVTAALGTRDRLALERLARLAPGRRGVVLTELHLLERVSDEPDREAREVRQRLDARTPEGWPLLDEADLDGWLGGLDLAALARDRRAEVAAVLLQDARRRTDQALAEAEASVERAEALLAEEDAALEQARRHGDRIAAHLLGAMRRRTEQLVLDLRTFLVVLEEDLAPQVAGLADTATLRHVLPHWLDHVVSEWMERQLAAWRAGVLHDVAELRIADAEARRAELLPPALHPAPLRAVADWSRRLAVTAAVGGGAALSVVGLWIPGLLIAGGGLAWSALTRQRREEMTREQLLVSAREAVRRMAVDAERLLAEQLAQIEEELARLGDTRARAVEEERAELRGRLVEQRAFHRARSEELRQVQLALAGGR